MLIRSVVVMKHEHIARMIALIGCQVAALHAVTAHQYAPDVMQIFSHTLITL